MSDRSALGLVNTKLSVEDNLQILRDNGIETSKKLANLGTTLLKEKKSRVAQSTSSATYVPLTEWQFGVKTSGGLVEVKLETYVAVNGNQAVIELLVDDAVKKEVNFGSVGLAYNNLALTWCGELVKGNHTFKFSVKSTTGNVDIGSTLYDSTCYVIEFNNGG